MRRYGLHVDARTASWRAVARTLLARRRRRRLIAPALPDGETLRALALATAPGVLVVDRSGTVLLCKPAAHRLIGRSEEELVGSRFGVQLVPDGVTEIDTAARDGSARAIEIRVTDTIWDTRWRTSSR